MIEALPDIVNTNAALVRRGRWTTARLLIGIGERGWIVVIDRGRLSVSSEDWRVSDWDFAIRGPEEAWRKFWAPMPPPMHHDLHALVRIGKFRLEGNIDLMLANMLYLKLVLETLRGRL